VVTDARVEKILDDDAPIIKSYASLRTDELADSKIRVFLAPLRHIRLPPIINALLEFCIEDN
jgi:hypothetical protein